MNQPIRILIADDAEAISTRVASLLEEEFDAEIVGPARDGAEAVALFASALPDAAVLDFAMPNGTGLDVLKAIRAHGSRCFVVIYTAYDDESVRRACFDAGANDVVRKGDGYRIPEVIQNGIKSGTIQ